MIEPIWEYHHDVGKSITGGDVYRGKRLPELDGHYLYADYVTDKIWALKYDEGEEARRRQPPDPRSKRADPVVRRGQSRRSLLHDEHGIRQRHLPLCQVAAEIIPRHRAKLACGFCACKAGSCKMHPGPSFSPGSVLFWLHAVTS